MFPIGAAGVALLILRFSLAAMFFFLAFQNGNTIDSISLLLLLSATSLCLMIGFCTPFACAVSCLLEAYSLSGLHGIDACHAALFLPITMSLALLGPGAFSLDARLFGRRVLKSTALSNRDL